jgi:hypothetical protein
MYRAFAYMSYGAAGTCAIAGFYGYAYLYFPIAAALGYLGYRLYGYGK